MLAARTEILPDCARVNPRCSIVSQPTSQGLGTAPRGECSTLRPSWLGEPLAGLRLPRPTLRNSSWAVAVGVPGTPLPCAEGDSAGRLGLGHGDRSLLVRGYLHRERVRRRRGWVGSRTAAVDAAAAADGGSHSTVVAAAAAAAAVGTAEVVHSQQRHFAVTEEFAWRMKQWLSFGDHPEWN